MNAVELIASLLGPPAPPATGGLPAGSENEAFAAELVAALAGLASGDDQPLSTDDLKAAVEALLDGEQDPAAVEQLSALLALLGAPTWPAAIADPSGDSTTAAATSVPAIPVRIDAAPALTVQAAPADLELIPASTPQGVEPSPVESRPAAVPAPLTLGATVAGRVPPSGTAPPATEGAVAISANAPSGDASAPPPTVGNGTLDVDAPRLPVATSERPPASPAAQAGTTDNLSEGSTATAPPAPAGEAGSSGVPTRPGTTPAVGPESGNRPPPAEGSGRPAAPDSAAPATAAGAVPDDSAPREDPGTVGSRRAASPSVPPQVTFDRPTAPPADPIPAPESTARDAGSLVVPVIGGGDAPPLGTGTGGPTLPAAVSQGPPLLTAPHQILTRLEVLARQGGGSAQLELDPPHLGKLHVALDVAASGVTTLHALATTPEARAIILAQLDDLRAAFQQAGLHIGDVSVELADSFAAGAQADREGGASGPTNPDDPNGGGGELVSELLTGGGPSGNRIDFRA